MPKTMIKPGPDLLQRVNQAFLDYGYSGLSMVTMTKACGFSSARCGRRDAAGKDKKALRCSHFTRFFRR
jgi:hypothetical protein